MIGFIDFLGHHAGKLVNLSENIYASTKTRENAHVREVMRNEYATLNSLYPSLLATAKSPKLVAKFMFQIMSNQQ